MKSYTVLHILVDAKNTAHNMNPAEPSRLGLGLVLFLVGF